MPTLRVIGGGRAGLALDAALRRAGWAALPVLRHGEDLTGAAEGCDLLVLAVPDHAVAATAARVRPGAAAVAHLAGALPAAALAPHARRAVLHPVASLPDPALGAERLRGAWFAVDPAADAVALEAVEALGGRAVVVADADRAAHHAACAMAANHATALLGAVERVAASAGLPLGPYAELAAATVAGVAAGTRPAEALTGPVARGDWATVAAHLAALPEDERPGYLALAGQAARLAGRAVPAGLGVRPEGCTVLHEKAPFRKALDAARAAGLTVGLVPTMGALHEGHAALVRRAAAECDVVAVTVFVNPLQFDRAEDLAAYPRTLDADVATAAAAGATYVLAPTVQEVYGDGALAKVHVEGLADRLEGAARPGHFDGVATVVTKLFGMTGPCRAYFGEKDFQQVAVVRRLVHDLDLPVEVVPCATVRADDGLALSSRNALLTPEERAVAPALRRALQVGLDAVAAGERDAAAIAAAVEADLARTPAFRLDRVDVVDAATLEAPTSRTTELRLLIAAFLGRARLIDNVGAAL